MLFRIYSLVVLGFFANLINAQSWQIINQIGAAGNESVSGLEVAANDHVYVCGQFDNELQIGNINMTPDGRDVFLAKLDENGMPIWTVQGTSPGNDASAELAVSENGNAYWIGSYWIAADFGGVHLEVLKGSKSSFIVKTNAAGMVEWGISVDGTLNKNLLDIVVGENENTYISGNFSDSLFFQDTFLVAANDLDLFVVKMDADGNRNWLSHIPSEGYFIPNRIVVDQSGKSTVMGNFRGEAFFGADFIKTNTNDDDVFIAQFDENGNPIWARKAGGVFEQFGKALTLDETGNIYAGGSFVGVISLNNEIQIQSPNSVSQVFLLKYASDGTPLWARSLGGFDEEFMSEMKYKDQTLIATGHYRGSLEFDDIVLSGMVDVNTAYFNAFNNNGQTLWVKPVTTDESIFGEQIAFQNDGDIICGGAFAGNALFDNQSISSNGIFDIYTTSLNNVFTNTAEASTIPNIFKVYPNPFNDEFHIQTDAFPFLVRIFNLEGQVVYTAQNAHSISLDYLPDGIYFVRLQSITSGKVQEVKIIKFSNRF